jgi:hypothetical protein
MCATPSFGGTGTSKHTRMRAAAGRAAPSASAMLCALSRRTGWPQPRQYSVAARAYSSFR